MNLCIFFKTHTETHRQICIKNYVCTFTHTQQQQNNNPKNNEKEISELSSSPSCQCIPLQTLVVNSCKIDSFFWFKCNMAIKKLYTNKYN